MPELPEVETVRRVLQREVKGKVILSVDVYWENIIAEPNHFEFKKGLKNEKIIDVKRYGKWLIFELSHYFLLSHLRMEGKYYVKDSSLARGKHQHVIFHLNDGIDLRYNDTRKFGKMYLLDKKDIYKVKPLSSLGLEPWDEGLTVKYLKEHFHRKPIKTELLDQSIITGIGNIYADEILFLSRIHPLKIASDLKNRDYQNIIDNTKKVLGEAIENGGTTIKSYTSSEGVHGRFQNHLLVHTKDKCTICGGDITKITVAGRGTYYCKNCQKERIV